MLPDLADGKPGPARRGVWFLLVAVAYLGAARLGLAMASIHGAVSPVWPATGVAIGALVVGGIRLWPAVLAGAFLANLAGPVPWWVAAAIALGNTGEAVVGGWLVRWMRDRTSRIAWAGEAAGCIAAAILAPLVSTFVGVSALEVAGGFSDGVALDLARTWWVGDALGALAVTPLVLAGARIRAGGAVSLPGLGVAASVATTVAMAVFFLPWGGALLFAVFPALFVAVYWGGDIGVKLAAAVVSAVGIAASLSGNGPFSGGALNDNLLFLQLFLASVSFAALFLPVVAGAGGLVIAGILLMLGWTASGWLFARMHGERVSADRMRLESMAADAERGIRQRMATYLESIRAGAGLFAASERVTQTEWKSFVDTLGLRKRFPGINGMGMVWRVRHDALDAFIEERRRDGNPGFALHPVPGGAVSPGPERYIIGFVEPLELNRRGPGLDMSSEGNRRQAAEEARDTGEPRASSRITLVDERIDRIGFMVFHPVYQSGAVVATVQDRRKALVGWIFAPFYASDFLEQVYMAPELDLTVFDGRSIDEEVMLYTSRPEASRRLGFEKVTTIELAGNLVTLAWNRNEQFRVASPVASVLTASSLALVTLMLAGMAVTLQSVGRQAREIAASRTVELTAAQATLAGINRLQHAVLDSTVYSIIATELDGTIRVFNRGAERLLGYRRDEMIGRQTPSIIHVPEEVVARSTELTAELGRNVEPGFGTFVARAALGEVEQREWTYVRKNGSRVPVLLSVTAMRDETGAVTGYVGIAHDLTERRALEQSLQLEQSRLRLANEAAEIAVWEWDVETGTLTWDAAMFGLYGMAPTVGGRVTYDDWRHSVHPDDLLAQEASLRTLIRDEGRNQREFRIIRHSDDEVCYISASELAIAGPDGRTVRVVGVNRNITERRRAMEQLRQSQARLSSIFDAVREGLVLQNADGRVLECNAAACRILGLTREQMQGQTSLESRWRAVREDGSDFPESEHPSAVTLRTGESIRDAVMGQRKPDDSIACISISTAAIRGPSGEVQAVVCSFSDVSAQRQIARDLARARDDALEASRLKSEFLATMSHEIRTPMNGIIGTVELLLGLPLDPTQNEMARLIQVSADNLLEIINDILDFSRIEAGKFRLNPEPFEVLPLIEDTATLLASRAQRKGLELVLDLEPSLASEVMIGDAGRIRQVLLNIIGNAVKFTDRGEVVVGASVRPGATGSGVLRVSVRDTGIGIAPEFRERLFHAFTQVDSSATRRFGGTGLGLAISRQLVDLMSGHLDFTSDPGHGSEFWIEVELPRQPGVRAFEVDGDLDVLVVDDNATARDALVRQVRRLGATARAVDGAADALAVLAGPAPAADRRRVVFIDGAMAATDCAGLVRRIRADHALSEVSLVLLATPGSGGAGDEFDGQQLSFVLSKPVRLAQLRVALAQARRGPAAAGIRPVDGSPAAGTPALVMGPGLRILVAEDNPANQLVARMVLESLGHRVDVADNGIIALERLGTTRYDVVFMDCQMPGVDGYETTRRVRSGTLPGVDPNQRIIALTAFAMESDREKCRAAGMDDYVSKPVRASDVRAVLGRCGMPAIDAGTGEARRAPESPAPAAFPAAIMAEPVLDDEFLDGLRALPGLHGQPLLIEVMGLYARETALRLEELPGLARDGRHDVLARIAHTLAGSSANAGAARARVAFAAVEHAARSGDTADLQDRIAIARQAWQEVHAELVRRQLLPV